VWKARALFSRAAAPWVVVVVAMVVAASIAARRRSNDAQCGEGFVASGARCMAPADACPAPLVRVGDTCDAPDVRVRVPATKLTIGPSDWEAEGRVPARTIETSAFYIDAFEATIAKLVPPSPDGARAASMVRRDDAAAYCASRGGRLPTDDEWLAAASSGAPNGSASRYPWGDTGAVCRRAAWGLARGPCSERGDGADTVGAHPTGDTALGVHDMAGNVAEWVVDPSRPDVGFARGGSWATDLATELRTWSRLELPPHAKDPRVGVRCAYDAP
jgi:formylglycine-generating enzyme required for sulfatase activity